jgi:hypothetical protein
LPVTRKLGNPVKGANRTIPEFVGPWDRRPRRPLLGLGIGALVLLVSKSDISLECDPGQGLVVPLPYPCAVPGDDRSAAGSAHGGLHERPPAAAAAQLSGTQPKLARAIPHSSQPLARSWHPVALPEPVPWSFLCQALTSTNALGTIKTSRAMAEYGTSHLRKRGARGGIRTLDLSITSSIYSL